MSTKLKRSKYTLEFKQEAVRLVNLGQSLAAVSTTLAINSQTLHNWVKLDRTGQLTSESGNPVSAEQMEISRLRAENARLKMERDILKKATAYFARESL
jgi:transposase